MSGKCQRLVLFAFASLLIACANVTPPARVPLFESKPVLPEFPNHFGARPFIPDVDAVLQLTQEQEQNFLAYFNLPANQVIKPHMRVSNYLFDNTINMQYEDSTYTAARTLELNKGNCMSLAILTTALARLADVDINYQLVDSSPVFGLEGNLVSKQVHVKSVVFKREKMQFADIGFHLSERAIIDYFAQQRGRFISNIDDAEFNAMFYLNIAGEALVKQDYTSAYWHTLEALAYNPLDATAWNIMAVIYRRAGDLAKAEEIYLFAITHAEDKLTLLKNYRLLLTSQMRIAEAAAIENRLNSMDDPSPFHWFALARTSYDMQDYEEAIRYFDKALAIAPYMHEAWLGKAQSLYQVGALADAELAMKMAIANVNRTSTRTLYEAKLMALAGK